MSRERIPRIEVWNMDSFKAALGEAGVQSGATTPANLDRLGWFSGIPVYETVLLAPGFVRIVTTEGERVIRIGPPLTPG